MSNFRVTVFVAGVCVLLLASSFLGKPNKANADECWDYTPGTSCSDAYGGWGPGSDTLCGGCTPQGETWYCDANFAWNYIIEPGDNLWGHVWSMAERKPTGFHFLATEWIDCVILSLCTNICDYDAEYDSWYCTGVSPTYLDVQKDVLLELPCPIRP